MGKIKQFFDRHQTLQQLLIVGVFAVITWGIGELGKLPLWLIWLTILFAVAFGLWIWNQFIDKSRKRISKLSDKETKDTIHRWITRSQFKVEPIPRDDALFSFGFEYTKGPQKVEVIRLKKSPYQLTLAVVIIFPEEVTTFLLQLPEPEKSNFIFDLGTELTRFGIGFRGVKQPFKELEIIDVVPLEDGLTEFYFLSRINFVFRAFTLAKHYVDKSLRNTGFAQIASD